MITIPKLRKETNSIKIHNEDLPDNMLGLSKKIGRKFLKIQQNLMMKLLII